MFFIIIALFIGLRHEVGADWYSYIGHLERASYISFTEILFDGDPGYVFLNWFAGRLGLGVWAVNLGCGVIFAFGLIAFALQQPRPWLCIVVAIPYLVIVVAMGYSRQGVAIGVALLGLVALSKGSVFRFVLWVALAATFHKTAIAIVPIAMLAGTENRVWTTVWVAASGLVLYFVFLIDNVDTLYTRYFEGNYESDGALIRVSMNAVPAMIYILFRKRFQGQATERKLWFYFSIAAICFIPILMVSPSTTAVDRIALYLIPVQLFVFSRLPDALGRQNAHVFVVGVVLYSALVQFVWLHFSNHSSAWIPYSVDI
ncbi:EpsG family protein [Aurantimonas aggregata]|uniref:EpsG family protein n=1 Tax=Aurantimonas aggregata TaxID=2047720 RepID=A0A6L9MMW6_9HYPH|nr:EpsG family protein [Aurantimonas aggregata]NDV89042.1 EpsG family protein [Aurantimonas aggregata]